MSPIRARGICQRESAVFRTISYTVPEEAGQTRLKGHHSSAATYLTLWIGKSV